MLVVLTQDGTSVFSSAHPCSPGAYARQQGRIRQAIRLHHVELCVAIVPIRICHLAVASWDLSGLLLGKRTHLKGWVILRSYHVQLIIHVSNCEYIMSSKLNFLEPNPSDPG